MSLLDADQEGRKAKQKSRYLIHTVLLDSNSRFRRKSSKRPYTSFLFFLNDQSSLNKGPSISQAVISTLNRCKALLESYCNIKSSVGLDSSLHSALSTCSCFPGLGLGRLCCLTVIKFISDKHKAFPFKKDSRDEGGVSLNHVY